MAAGCADLGAQPERRAAGARPTRRRRPGQTAPAVPGTPVPLAPGPPGARTVPLGPLPGPAPAPVPVPPVPQQGPPPPGPGPQLSPVTTDPLPGNPPFVVPSSRRRHGRFLTDVDDLQHPKPQAAERFPTVR